MQEEWWPLRATVQGIRSCFLRIGVSLDLKKKWRQRGENVYPTIGILTQTPSNVTWPLKTTVNSDCVAGKPAAATSGLSPFITVPPHTAARHCLGLTDHLLRMYLSCLLELRFLAWPITHEPEPPTFNTSWVIHVYSLWREQHRLTRDKNEVGGKLTIRILLTWNFVI